MQHKSKSAKLKQQSHLSTTISIKEIEILKRKLPTDWVDRVKSKMPYSAATIRDVLRSGKADHEVMQVVVQVAEDHQLEVESGVLELKSRITKLITA